ncbi:ATP-binding protein [Nonomuraea rubra]|uniref:DNA replication protein DnaC n=1 Tax=Nonomuraea rubra TaxID=46180 RepID=A0A7X0U5S2_9ACTN|nr:ATP-binding protein [Nonomuraea rubra]MBB6556216.1 DNA replication protein DnaC [Nonomuraea rubra]
MQAGDTPEFGPHSDPDEYKRWQLEQAVRGYVPPRFQAEIPIPEEVRAWAKAGRRAGGLYLTGPVGTGKTHLGFTALAEWCRNTETVPRAARYDTWDTIRFGPTVHTVRATALLDQLRPGVNDARLVVEDCQNARLLFIDDIGAEKPSEWTQEKLYEVIDERYSRCLPLIVTSNLPPRSLAEHVGERSASRLAEMCTLVPLTGPDRRRPS